MDLEKIYNACMVRGIQQKQKEFTELMQIIIDNKYKSVLEIGAYSNGCTYAFASICKKVVSIDLVHRSTERFNNVTYITGNSHEVRNDIGGNSAGAGNSILNFGGATGATNPAAGIRAVHDGLQPLEPLEPARPLASHLCRPRRLRRPDGGLDGMDSMGAIVLV